MGRVELEASRQVCRLPDTTCGFEPVERIPGLQRKPLTGRTSHVVYIDFKLQRPDIEERVVQIRASFDPCAADGREEVTPRLLHEAKRRTASPARASSRHGFVSRTRLG